MKNGETIVKQAKTPIYAWTDSKMFLRVTEENGQMMVIYLEGTITYDASVYEELLNRTQQIIQQSTHHGTQSTPEEDTGSGSSPPSQ